MRIISPEFRQMLKKSDVFALFSSARKPDHSKLDKKQGLCSPKTYLYLSKRHTP